VQIRTFDKRTIESEPDKGKVIDVKIDTHVSGSIEFVNGAIATLIASLTSGIPNYLVSKSTARRAPSASGTSIWLKVLTCLAVPFSFAISTTIAGKDCRVASHIPTGAKFRLLIDSMK
jgi:hypothetical protein